MKKIKATLSDRPSEYAFEIGNKNKKITCCKEGQDTSKPANLGQRGQLGVFLENKENGGVIVERLTKESAAEAAGIKIVDEIAEIDGQKVSSYDDVIRELEDKKAGDTVQVTYLRDENPTTTAVILKENQKAVHWNSDEHQFHWKGGEDWNFEFENTNKPFLGVILGEETDKGVLITGTEEETGARKAGLKAGDVIAKIDEVEVRTKTDLIANIKTKMVGDTVEVTYIRNRKIETVPAVLGSRKMVVQNFRKKENISKTKRETSTVAASTASVLEPKQLDIFPNPNQGVFTLNFEGEAVATTILVTDITGQEIFKKVMANFNGTFNDRLDISGNAAGTYFLTIIQGDKKVTKNLILGE
jgi:predicted metalloprotease with PDZ domain